MKSNTVVLTFSFALVTWLAAGCGTGNPDSVSSTTGPQASGQPSAGAAPAAKPSPSAELTLAEAKAAIHAHEKSKTSNPERIAEFPIKEVTTPEIRDQLRAQ